VASSYKYDNEPSKIFISWGVMQCSPLKVNWRFGGKCRLPFAFTLVSCSAYSLTLKMEAKCSSATLLNFQWTTWRYIPENRALRNHQCENLKSNMKFRVLGNKKETNLDYLNELYFRKKSFSPNPSNMSYLTTPYISLSSCFGGEHF
jgi:hypothetical protein